MNPARRAARQALTCRQFSSTQTREKVRYCDNEFDNFYFQSQAGPLTKRRRVGILEDAKNRIDQADSERRGIVLHRPWPTYLRRAIELVEEKGKPWKVARGNRKARVWMSYSRRKNHKTARRPVQIAGPNKWHDAPWESATVPWKASEHTRLHRKVEKQFRLLDEDNSVTPQNIKVPDIRKIFRESEIQAAVEGVRGDEDIESHPYRILVSTILERPPIVTPGAPAAETDYVALEREMRAAQGRPQMLSTLVDTYHGEEETERRRRATTTPRVTPEDEAENHQSLNRCLDKRLYFICKRGGQPHWEMPWEERGLDETLADTAERAVRGRASNYIGFCLSGQTPTGHNEVEYPEDAKARLGKHGAQVFFMRAYYLNGNSRTDAMPDVEDFKWVTKADLETHLNPKMWASLSELLLD